MKRNFTRAAALLLSLVMSLSLLSVSAFAGTDGLEQITGKLTADGKLTENVPLTGRVDVRSDLSIDLAGHSITMKNGWSGSTAGTDYGLIQVFPGAKLTVTDSVGGGSITASRKVGGFNVGPLSAICAFGPNATVTINGNITATSDNIVLYAYRGGEITANAGTYTAAQGGGYAGYNNSDSKDNLTIAGKQPKSIGGVWVMVSDASITDVSISLEGKIGINAYVVVPEADDGQYEVVMTREGGETIRRDASDPTETRPDGTRVFSYPVTSTQMSDEVTVTLVKKNAEQAPVEGGGASPQTVATQTLSVQGYDDKTDADSPRKDLTAALTTFGKFSKENFKGNGWDNVEPNEGESEKERAVQELNVAFSNDTNKENNIDNNKAGIGGSIGGLSFKGAALRLDEDTALRLYFDGLSAVNCNNLTFKYYMVGVDTADREEITPKQSSDKKDEGMWYVEIPNIAAAELSEKFMVEVYEEGKANYSYRVRYSPMTYVRQILKDTNKYSGDLVNLVKALYLYNQKAVSYFSN